MARFKKYKRQFHVGATAKQVEKVENISKLIGWKEQEVIRRLIDSSLPLIDPTDKFWQICKNSSIFSLDLPANTVVPYVASFLDLLVSGRNEIRGIKINVNAPSGISPILWALSQIKEIFYGKSLPSKSDKQSEFKND